MKQIGEIMIEKYHNWKPVAVGFLTLFIDNIADINIAVQILVGMATFVYIISRTYYLIKNKGKEKK